MGSNAKQKQTPLMYLANPIFRAAEFVECRLCEERHKELHSPMFASEVSAGKLPRRVQRQGGRGNPIKEKKRDRTREKGSGLI